MAPMDDSPSPLRASRDENEMWAEVESLPALIRDRLRPTDETVRRLLDHNECLSVKQIFITGCGDSHNAGVAAEMAFDALAGIPAQALPAMQFSRYTIRTLRRDFPRSPLVVGISTSGEVSRTIEALTLARRHGALTVALTGNGESRAARAAEKVLAVSTESYGRSPGVRTYAMSLLSLYLLAIRLGEVAARYTQSEADDLRAELMGTADTIEATIAASAQAALAIGTEMGADPNFVFVGSGPNYATALFGAAKMVEAAGKHVIGQEMEEWAHLQYFSKEAATPTVLIAPPGESHDRAAELVQVMRHLGRRIIAVVAEDERDIAPHADVVLPIRGKVREMFSPLVSCVPVELLAAVVSHASGEPYFRQTTPTYDTGNGIRLSHIRAGLSE
ncbi:MAG: SIS domain-containing protein [Thermomicrobia bacterium]|nr:SIS domain-containing protein [Thermomicrobia bacterium]